MTQLDDIRSVVQPRDGRGHFAPFPRAGVDIVIPDKPDELLPQYCGHCGREAQFARYRRVCVSCKHAEDALSNYWRKRWRRAA